MLIAYISNFNICQYGAGINVTSKKNLLETGANKLPSSSVSGGKLIQLFSVYYSVDSCRGKGFAFTPTMWSIYMKIAALLIPCMKMILRADQNPCPDVALLRLYIRIHTLIQQRQNSCTDDRLFVLRLCHRQGN